MPYSPLQFASSVPAEIGTQRDFLSRPIGASRFNSTHLGTTGITSSNGFCIVANGDGNFRNLVTDTLGTAINGGGTNADLSVIRNASLFAGPEGSTHNRACIIFTGKSTANIPGITFGMVCQFRSVNTGYEQCLAEINATVPIKLLLSPTGILRFSITGGNNGSTGFSPQANVPYFFAASCRCNNTPQSENLAFIAVNLETGETFINVSADCFPTAGSDGTYRFGNSSTLDQACDAYIAAASGMPNYRSANSMFAWAANPWNMWVARPVGPILGELGKNDATGWTDVLPADGTGPTGSITTYLFAADAAHGGNNSNDGYYPTPISGTTHGPKEGLRYAYNLMWFGGLFWLLAQKGSVFTHPIGSINKTGKSESEPQIYSCYDPTRPLLPNPPSGGARPIIPAKYIPVPPENSPYQAVFYMGSANDYTGFIGLDIYGDTNDPKSVTFDPRNIPPICAFQWRGSAARHWMLFEDINLRYPAGGIYLETAADSSGVTANAYKTMLRRCIFNNCWSIGVTHGILGAYEKDSIIHENIFHGGGWSREASAAQPCTIIPGNPTTIIWNGSFNFPFRANFDFICFPSLGTGTPHHLNESGGGSPRQYTIVTVDAPNKTFTINVDTTGDVYTGSPTVAWINAAWGGTIAGDTLLKSHNYYIKGGWAPDFRGNITCHDSGGPQLRVGGEIHDNLYFRNPSALMLTAGSTELSTKATYNVVMEGGVRPDLPNPVNMGQSLDGIAIGDWHLTNLVPLDQIHHNIVAGAVSNASNASFGFFLAQGCRFITPQYNIIYYWGNPVHPNTALDNVPSTFNQLSAATGSDGAIRSFHYNYNRGTSAGAINWTGTVALIGGHGTGATATIKTGSDGKVKAPWPLDYYEDLGPFAPDWINETLNTGGLSLVDPGIDFATWDVLTVDPNDPNYANVPPGFSCIVGPYKCSFQKTTGSGIGYFSLYCSVDENGVVDLIGPYVPDPISGILLNTTRNGWLWSGLPQISGYQVGDQAVPISTDTIGGATGIVIEVATLCVFEIDETNVLDGEGLNTAGFPLHGGYSYPNNVMGNNTIGAYAESIGLERSTEAFLQAALMQQTRATWNPALTAHAVNEYIRAGFGLV